MNDKFNILVFPCGSEIGLEIHRSLKYSIHVNLFGGNSIDDHGKFVYENYIGGLPFFDSPEFLSIMKGVIAKYQIDAIYPAMDAVIEKLSSLENDLGCKIIGSPYETNQICLSKEKTYSILNNKILTPKVYNYLEDVDDFPVFMKPVIGYGARGAKLINDHAQGVEHLGSFPTCMILEYLPGEEYTVDCFTDRGGNLLFSRGRVRKRISNGISVNTIPDDDHVQEFERIAAVINSNIKFRGAWFYQVKENNEGQLCLLEVASRLGGSSSLFRNLGINFALLSVFDAFDMPVKVFLNNYKIELDRALDNKYRVDINFDTAYIDFDDCLLLGTIVNTDLVKLLYQFLNEGKKLVLITKHERDINQSLTTLRLLNVFDQIIHLEKNHYKYEYMQKGNAIFIDDSFAERYQVHEKLGLPVFAPDNIECLLK